jgi:non-lysosomal glucosylceramidase
VAEESRCCGGRCCTTQPIDLNRRDFMEKVAAGAAALAVIGDIASAADTSEKTRLKPPKPAGEQTYPQTLPRVYKGAHLEAVGMPIGGIGTGSIWLDGQGRLGVWQIFNNLSEPRIPDSFFAVRARQGSGEAVTRVLQTVAEGSLRAVESLEFEAGYPIARLEYHDSALPVRIVLEALNPMIPLDALNSSIPCALFRLTATNPGKTAAEVTLCAALQNAVGSGGAANIQSVRFAGYGKNRNRVLRENGRVTIAMDKSENPVASGPVKVRAAGGSEVRGPELHWLVGLSDLTTAAAEHLTRIAAESGVVLADGLSKSFFETLASLRAKNRDFSDVANIFEDFEKQTYEGWTITGTAFGKGPSHGTEAGQQPVSGFVGRGLVNTYLESDAPQGTATSKPFSIQRRYIGFLIGGGSHPNQTCINLRVAGKIVRTATGKDREALEPASWDVADLKGKEAAIEIVDHNSEGWGHINIDQIIFSDIPPEPLLRRGTAIEVAANALNLPFSAAEEATLRAESAIALTDRAPAALKPIIGDWKISRYTRLRGYRSGDRGYQTLVATSDGDPLVIEGPLGKGRIIMALAPGLPWNWGSEMLTAARAEPLKPGERLVPGNAAWGTMALAALDSDAVALSAWSTAEELAAFMSDPAHAKRASDEATSKLGQTINAALAVPFTLEFGESRSVTFAITWHFPNVQRFQHSGNLYSRRWPDATAVADHLGKNLDALWQWTHLYRDTLYQSNLPEEFLDAMSSQSVILRGPTCFWSEEGYFGGFEGSYGCCPLNCTHVWNYAQSHARLFPTIGQNMRISNFITFLHPNGETSHREHAPHPAFIDGHCACIEAAYREHQLSPDRQFLEKIWPGVKKAVNWLIGAIDRNHEGLPHGKQPNTYDTSVSGANTFIGSQYLAALSAAIRMADVMNERPSAVLWKTVRDAGMKNQNEKLWNGEYYIQIPEPQPANDYDTGCHADQLLGQWWAHMLNLGYLYPAARVKSALAAIMKHNFRAKFAGFKQAPRRYIPDDDGGLIICTWPRGGRPNPFILYADEAWTGIEYAVAGAMIYEGLIDEARQIVRTARSRYDGRRRDGLDSGPGGNPFNELECGKFYARAMSSWSLLIASQGLVVEGPKGILGFKPKWRPDDHRSFFTASEGWGLFIQERKNGQQTERIEMRRGRLQLSELMFELPKGASASATVTIAGRPTPAALQQSGAEIRLVLEREVIVAEAEAIEVALRWPG